MDVGSSKRFGVNWAATGDVFVTVELSAAAGM